MDKVLTSKLPVKLLNDPANYVSLLPNQECFLHSQEPGFSLYSVIAQPDNLIFPKYKYQAIIGNGCPLYFITKTGIIKFYSQTKPFPRNIRKWVFPKLLKYPLNSTTTLIITQLK